MKPSVWSEVAKRTWSKFPPERQCDLIWVWRWCRPCTVRDYRYFQMWVDLGMPDGIERFLVQEEPVWMVNLLSFCFPQARLEDLERVVSTFCCVASSTINKQRLLRRRGPNAAHWINESESVLKEQLDKTDYFIDLIKLKAWNDEEILWLNSSRSLHGGMYGPTSELLIGPIEITRWFTDKGIFQGDDKQTGVFMRAWSIKMKIDGNVSRGYMRPAYGSGPEFRGSNRSWLHMECADWSSPWPENPPGNPAAVLLTKTT